MWHTAQVLGHLALYVFVIASTWYLDVALLGDPEHLLWGLEGPLSVGWVFGFLAWLFFAVFLLVWNLLALGCAMQLAELIWRIAMLLLTRRPQGLSARPAPFPDGHPKLGELLLEARPRRVTKGQNDLP